MTLRRFYSALFGFPNGMNFLSDVNGHGAPGDAAATANAAGSSKLVNPRGQLVSHPLAVSGLGAGADAAAVDIREIHCEAGIPSLPALRVVTLQAGDVFNGGAKACGTDHGTVGAGEAAGRHIVPSRIPVIAVKQLLNVGCVHLAAHLAGRARHGRRCRRLLGCIGG